MKRALFRVLVVFILAYAVPASAGSQIYAAIAVLAVIVLLTIVLLMALNRMEKLNEWISIELNKVRRMYHLGKNLGSEDHLRAWFTEMHGYVYEYLMAFENRDFADYQETNGAFRKLSYHVYQIPSLKTEKEKALYNELLGAAGLVAGSRQRIKQLWDGGLPAQMWNILVVMAALAGAAVLFAAGTADRLVSALLLSLLVLTVTLVRDMDSMKMMAGKEIAKKYVENIARLELSRHDKKEN